VNGSDHSDDPSELEPAPSPDGPAPGAPADPSVRRSRAGRDLPAAIVVGVGLGASIIASLVVARDAFVVVVLLIGLIGVREVANALGTNGTRVLVWPVSIGGSAMLLGAWLGGTEWLVVALGLAMLTVLVWRLPAGPAHFVRDVTASVFVLIWVPLLGAFVVLLRVPDDGVMRVVAFVVATVASDTGGYVVGVLAGRHPMAPTISPKKSWEGMAGSVVAAAVAGWLTVSLGLGGPAWVGVLLGVVTAVAATIGDLTESLVKRDLSIKDMGSLLPGHGGMMDRLDSLLFVAPLAWLVLDQLVPVAS
jgi:phosphatidate cytidylyltransferase